MPNEIDEMLDSIERRNTNEQDTEQQVISHDTAQDDSDKEQVAETSDQQEQKEEKPEKDQKVENTDNDSDEEDEQESDVSLLRKKIDELSSQKPQLGETPAEEQETKDEQPDEPEQPTKKEVEDHFDVELTDDEYDSIMSDSKSLSKFLMRFGNQIRQQTTEDVLRKIPDVVSRTTSRQHELLRQRDKFFTDNPDVAEFKGYAGHVANEIQSQNPKMSLQDVLSKTAEKVRKDLALNSQAVEKEDDRLKKQTKKQEKPAFAPGPKGSRPSTGDDRTELQKDLDDMLAVARK